MGKNLQNKKQNRLFFILIFLLAAVGIGLTVYPMLAANYKETVRSEVHSQYEDIIQEEDTSQIDALLQAAYDYNRKLFLGEIDRLEPAENGYFEQLKLESTRVMAYINIPRINVTLPVYHGIGNDALSDGCGHLPQSSLPVGGMNTHSVISAHTGMADSPMFSDLQLLTVGDIFQIEILGQVLTYQIQAEDDINVVLPHEVSNIQIQNGKDLCTLVTCTPFGINSHRLLVREHRIPTPETNEEIQQLIPETDKTEKTSIWVDNYWKTIRYCLIAGGVVLLIGVPLILFLPKKKRCQRKQGE